MKDTGLILLTQTKNHCPYPILDNQTSPFYHVYEDKSDRHHHQLYFSEPPSPPFPDPNYPQNQRSNLDSGIEVGAKQSSPPPPSSSPFIKRILVVDDDPDLTLTFKAALDGQYYNDKKRFEVYAYNDPLLVLTQFKPHFYDLLLTDIYMPYMNGFQLFEKILEQDVNIRVCFMSAAEINIHALREVYPNVGFGCFIKKPITIRNLIKRLSAELD